MAKNLSPNFDKRPKGIKPSMLILHYTGMPDAAAALERLCDPVSKVSAHYLIDEDGKTKQLVRDKDRAWHAGVSFWEGKTDINAHSIGIEIVNPGHEHGYRSFPPVQMLEVASLCKKLVKKYKIQPTHVLAHSDVAPERKEDPGEFFDWHYLNGEGIGLWPQVTQDDLDRAAEKAGDAMFLQKRFEDYGYNPQTSLEALTLAFHRHFCPEKFKEGANPKTLDQTSISKLLALSRQKKAP